MPRHPGGAPPQVRRCHRDAGGVVHACADVPRYIRSDNGPEFIAEAVQGWIVALGARTAYITPDSPWENGYVESFNARLRDELLRW